jgi:hypothetical protein
MPSLLQKWLNKYSASVRIGDFETGRREISVAWENSKGNSREYRTMVGSVTEAALTAMCNAEEEENTIFMAEHFREYLALMRPPIDDILDALRGDLQ